ncbi:sporulation-control protein [Allocatelliglobosispora scoriae]|uniref:Sporulation-control protein n=1 Tax=Allocatelliglobosispora scoriae TaxID=643052 RepID=A0A841BIS9_9ACTN|nr:sporulation protein [Allocatelliglobosispora scoriae]MBB5866963.1 sporulation-control protein [Allocatelliglobosispora scoriae]
MVFKKLLGSLGIGGPTVDTVLTSPSTQPAGRLTGNVHVRGGGRDVEIEYVTLILSVQANVAGGFHSGGGVELLRVPVAGRFPLASDSTHAIPFSIELPPTTPFNAVYGNLLPGMTMGLRTELSVAKSSDKTDLDPVVVEPMRAQQQILDALGTIGCRYIRTDLRPGGHVGVPVPYVQRVVFLPPFEGRPTPQIPQISFTFAADGQALHVTVETGRTSGDRHSVAHADAERTDWVEIVDSWLRQAFSKPQPAPNQGGFMGGQQGYGQQQYGRPGYGGHQQPYAYHRKPGMGVGGAVAAGVGGAALGFLGGMVIGDMIGDAFSPDGADASNFADGGDGGYTEMGGADSGGDYGGGDYGGGDYASGAEDFGAGDFGGGDFGGGDFGGGDFGGGDFGGDF